MVGTRVGTSGVLVIVTRTPLRVSFLGGGSDYPSFFKSEQGAVFGTAIDLHVFVAVIRQTALVDKKYKLTYRVSEAVDDPALLQHPVVRSVLTELRWHDPGLHIATLADVPANTGLGSSSSFTVSLLHALSLFRGESPTPEKLARDAIRIERDILGEAGGWQDQYHAAYGGVGLYTFLGEGVSRHPLTDPALEEGLNESMVLVPVGGRRRSHDHAQQTSHAVSTESGSLLARELSALARQTFDEVQRMSDADRAVRRLAEAIRTAWTLKSRLSGSDLSEADSVIRQGIRNGALAGKLCGAGGSGFILFLTEVGDREGFLSRARFSQVETISVSKDGSCKGPSEWM